MKVKIKKSSNPTKIPCLMENQFGEIFLVTDGYNGRTFVTRLSDSNADEMTWESELKDYKPLPKGTKVEIIN